MAAAYSIIFVELIFWAELFQKRKTELFRLGNITSLPVILLSIACMSCDFLLNDLPPFHNSSWHAEETGSSSPHISQAALELALGQVTDILWSESSVCGTITRGTWLLTPLLDLGKLKLGCCLPGFSRGEFCPLWPLWHSSNSSPLVIQFCLTGMVIVWANLLPEIGVEKVTMAVMSAHWPHLHGLPFICELWHQVDGA